MRTPLIGLLLMLCTAPAARAANEPNGLWHVRPLTDSTKALLADAVRRSDIIAGLVRDLNAANVIVYVVDGIRNDSSEPSASLRFISCAGGVRYLLIKIDRWLAAPWVRIAELGHELQHAVEVARAPDVRDGKGLARLYLRIGWEGERGRFESEEAVRVGNRVLYQLLGFSR